MLQFCIGTHYLPFTYQDIPDCRLRYSSRAILGIFHKRIAGYLVSIDIDELADKVGNQGHTFCPATFMNNKRKATDFARMQVFTLDFDCGIPAEEVRRQAERCMLPVSFMYHSFSSTSECPRFRTAFVNDVPVTDKKAAEIILSMLLEIFPEADKSCKDVSRMFFGGKGVIGNVQDEVINIENLVEQYHRTCFVKEPKSYSRNILIVVLVHGIVLMSAGQD